ncbi:MAG: DUF3048 domain-containing protein [Mycobacteriales bacterium]
MSALTPLPAHPPLTRRRIGAVAVLAVGVLLAGCGSQATPAAEPPPSPSAPLPPPPPPPPPPAPAPTDPLTGGAAVPPGPVIALKIDNSPLARPFHRGLGEADLIYQEVMEGGATRFLAIYAPATPTEVGPIRSVREGDIELVRQFGRIALGSSGGNTGVLATVAKAASDGVLLDATFDVTPSAYRKAERRRDAINFFTSPQKVDQVRPGGSPVKDIGLRFGPLAPGATPAGRASVRFSDISQVSAVYNAASGRYAVLQNGDQMKDFAPANVVVQTVQVRNSLYVDVLGNRTPYTSTVGKGPVTILRDGQQVSGTWDRPTFEAGTRLLDAAGADLPLEVGPTMFLLVPAGRMLNVG